MTKNIKVFIGTLYAGENEIDECINSVKEQTFKNIKHEVFKDLPNKMAHHTLYKRFMALQEEYDYFIKLDADMVFKDSTIVEQLVAIFQKDNKIDQAVFSVHDWCSNSNIFGMHMFTDRVKWDLSKEDLFVDPDPIKEGEKLVVTQSPSPVADHSPNPSFEQAFIFGYHRALKVVQRGRFRRKSSRRAQEQLQLLQLIWQGLQFYQFDERRLAVIIGAEYVFKNNCRYIEDKTNIAKTDYYNQLLLDSLLKKYDKRWNKSSFMYTFRFFIYVTFPYLILYLPKKAKKLTRKIMARLVK